MTPHEQDESLGEYAWVPYFLEEVAHHAKTVVRSHDKHPNAWPKYLAAVEAFKSSGIEQLRRNMTKDKS